MIFPSKNISEYARLTLEQLAAHHLGNKLSLGGAFGLLHYLDYRPTHDVDAWWLAETTSSEQAAVLTVIEDTLAQFGQVKRRAWGDVTSIELLQAEGVVFSFQIAHRSAQLQPSTPAGWTDVLLDSLADLIAGKMVALVERGAPRDFRDIYQLCRENLTTPAQCWQWWEQRQILAGSDASHHRARLAVETHLSRIIQHRPLESIDDPNQRNAAQQVRSWFQTEFLDALEN
jgi:predicted nucleotidyltransferase component of viral defense system